MRWLGQKPADALGDRLRTLRVGTHRGGAAGFVEGGVGGGDDRRARFVCVTSLARGGRVVAITSDYVDGALTHEPRGAQGFGYDPIFFCTALGHTFAEASQAEKNNYSHRGRAFRKALGLLLSQQIP